LPENPAKSTSALRALKAVLECGSLLPFWLIDVSCCLKNPDLDAVLFLQNKSGGKPPHLYDSPRQFEQSEKWLIIITISLCFFLFVNTVNSVDKSKKFVRALAGTRTNRPVQLAPHWGHLSPAWR
jgi:hypothetical protein